MSKLSEIFSKLFSEMDKHFVGKYHYKDCFDLNRFPINPIFEKLDKIGIDVFRINTIVIDRSQPLNPVYSDYFLYPEEIYFDQLDFKIQLKDGTTIIPVTFLKKRSERSHANVFLIRKDGNEISTVYIEPHGRFEHKGIRMDLDQNAYNLIKEEAPYLLSFMSGFKEAYPDENERFDVVENWIDNDFPLDFTNEVMKKKRETVDMMTKNFPKLRKMNVSQELKNAFHKWNESQIDFQEIIRAKIEKLIELSYPNAKFNHYGIQSKINIQHDDVIGYCATVTILICYFSYLINECNPQFCENISNKHYIEVIAKILAEFSSKSVEFKYDKSISQFCQEGGFLCQFNIFFFCFLLYTGVLEPYDINYHHSKNIQGAFQFCEPIMNDFHLKKLVLGYSEDMKNLVLKY